MASIRSGSSCVKLLLVALVLSIAPAAAKLESGEPIEIHRIAAPIEIDGDLSDPGWAGATRIDSWWETNPGDNVEPSVANVAWLAFDDRYLYAAFEFDDPEPAAIRAPFADRDNVPYYTDYGGVILDPRGDGKTAQMFLANARGIQYDAISSDASGEDDSPDFFWESAGSIADRGWRLEIRIPFSSIRYVDPNPEAWGILLYRNHPRAYRQQYFSSRLPRERNCFICNVRELKGMADLPSGANWVVAPYATAAQSAEPEGGLGTRLESDSGEVDGGFDLKWLPNPNTAVDVTLNPDFSQIESDEALITTNERFAIFLPEKRPFFLEGVDLLSTPVNAVYTRTFSSPRWGARATGSTERWKYTLLVGEDRGGGSVILPGSQGSDLADQDFGAIVAIGRARRDFGKGFASLLYSGRELDGGGSNRVFGPDFEWRPTEQDTISGQLLWSASETPNRPDLADEWDGRTLSGYAGEIRWSRSTGTWDSFALYESYDDEFRADNGFVPQVGYSESFVEIGRTFRWEDRPIRRLRTFAWYQYQVDSDGRVLAREAVVGSGLDAPLNSFLRLEVAATDVRAGNDVLRRWKLRPYVEVRPGRVLQRVNLQGSVGDEVDFAENRLGAGGTVQLSTDVQPSDHLKLYALAQPALARRRRPRPRLGAPVHGGCRASARRLHLQRAHLAAADRPVGRDRARPVALPRRGRRAPGRPLGIARLRLQAQLADGALSRLLRPPGARAGDRPPRALLAPGLPQGLVRLPRLNPRSSPELDGQQGRTRRASS